MARLIDQVYGHSKNWELAKGLKARDRWPHAMIFTGPVGIGKFQFALSVAQLLFCEVDGGPCGFCGSCLKIEKKQFEDLILIEPDKELANPVIKVEKIRELLSRLSLANWGKKRLVIIDSADSMNTQAANALLKNLEEPSENIYFILIGSALNSFLPTIRSRSQVFRFVSLSVQDLAKVAVGQPDWAYRNARGSVDKLKKLIEKKGESEREDSYRLLQQFFQDPYFLTDKNWREDLKDKSWVRFNVQQWLYFLRDLIVYKNQSEEFVLNKDQKARFVDLQEVSSQKINAVLNQLVQIESELELNLDPVLIFESMWIKYAGMD